MKAHLSHPVFALTDKLRSAIRTRRRLHLETEQIAVLMEVEIYEAIMRLEATELKKACAATSNDNELQTSGSGSALVSALGTSAGLSELMVEASRGANRLALEAVTQTRRLKKR